MDARQQDIALFRYSLIREAADPELTPAERGRLVRRLADKTHVGPDGTRVRVSRPTLDRWIRAYRVSGYQGLVPEPRQGVPLTPQLILDAAAVLKRENPARNATHIAVMLGETGHTVSARTLQRFFAREGLNLGGGASRRAFGRFEAEARNDRWTGDAMHGRFKIGGRKPILFAFIDDHSRLVPGSRWGFNEDTIRLEAALRAGLESRGVPTSVYVDNGSPFVSRQLERACAVLGARLIHSRPGQPQGRGKIERFFRTVRADFEIEVSLAEPADLADLNRLFSAWLEQVYHRRPHTETGQTPLDRFETGNQPPTRPTPDQLHEAFLWSAERTVTATATVSMHANTYEVDAALIGRKVELVFDPFDLTNIEVRLNSQPMGHAVPHKIGRHTHPQARPDEPPIPPPASGIDYLRILDTRHNHNVANRINFAALNNPSDGLVNGQIEGQLQLPDTEQEQP